MGVTIDGMSTVLSADDLVSMVLFARVVEERSYTAAAERLGMRKSTVSRRITGLEQRLGVRLLNRTTRRLSLTDTGLELYRRCAKIAQEADEAARLAHGLGSEVRGVVKVNAPTLYGTRFLMPMIGEFLAQHREIEIALTLDDGFVDVVHGGFDVVVRIASDTRLRAGPGVGVRRIGSDRMIVCASPAYLRAHGKPATPEALAEHECLRYANNKPHEEWRFERDGEVAYVPVPSRFTATTAIAMLAATVAGVGISVGPSLMFEDDLARGALVELLPGLKAGRLSLYLLTPEPRSAPARVRAFTDFIAKHSKRSLGARHQTA